MYSNKTDIAAGPGLGLSTAQLYAAVEYVQCTQNKFYGDSSVSSWS